MPRKNGQKKKGGRRPVVQGPRTQSGQRPQIIYVDRPVKKQQPRKKPVQQKGLAEKVGGFLGRGAKAMFKAVTGFGDYKVGSNTLMGGSVPQVRNSPGGTIVRHREYVLDITSQSNFTNDSYPLNPGMSELFPWLSATAQNYEEYEWRGVILEFRSLASSLNASSLTSGLGALIMATQYNPLDPDFPDKRTMENYEFASSSKPSENCIHPIECKRSMNTATHLYVRTGPPEANADLRLYDLGNFQIARQGMPVDFNGTVIGELWVTYEVEFFKPKLVSTTGATALADSYIGANAQSGVPFGTNITSTAIMSANTCGCQFLGNLVLMPPTCHGRFYFNFYGTSATIANLILLKPTNTMSCTYIVGSYTNVVNNASQTGIFTEWTGNASIFWLSFMVDVTPAVNLDNPTFTIPFNATNANWAVTMHVVQVPPSFNGVAPTYP